ncbi:MAG: DUF5695 domain-containing protein [Mangrovibacterium sp.]
MTKYHIKRISLLFCLFLCLLAVFKAYSQYPERQGNPETPVLGDDFLDYATPTIKLQLVRSSQTVSELKTVNADNFDFTPHGRLSVRNTNGFYHLGDINLRLRQAGNSNWSSWSSAEKRQPVEPIAVADPEVLAAASMANTFPTDFPLEITRYWQQKDDHLVLRFDLKNKTSEPIEIGALGIPLIFNNDLDRKTLEEAHAENVFYDPYIGLDAGYLQVIRLDGEGQVLLVLPWGKSPFEAWRPLPDDPTPRGITFEGFHEWMIHSKAYAEQEWKEAGPWNLPSSKILAPDEIYQVGLEFVLADSVKGIEEALQKHHRPVVVGIPGYVLPMDVEGNLFLKCDSKVRQTTVEPSGALKIDHLSTTPGGWEKYRVQGTKWGRARLTVTYEDGTIQTVSYKIIKPESEVVADNGRFLMDKQWYENDSDLFGRSPSVISYDYEAQKQLTQDSRAWIAGLSDEGGAGSWLNAIMKQLVQPDPEQIVRLETFVNQTIWGGIQYSEGKNKYGVRKSMFYYEPDSMPEETYSDTISYKTWAAWPKKEAGSVGRSYNYPHVAAAYWVMYRLARNYNGLATQQSWNWYLEQAFHTAMAMTSLAPYYARYGQMEGTVFLLILKDLKAEGMTDLADQLEEVMKSRALHWATLPFPFGSEMPWDSTGQEEVYVWSDYFGFSEKVMVTIKAILAYMPAVPHWAYNGNARRYWDFLYAGKLKRIERMIHHYGSALNAIPVLNEYRHEPNDLYLLRVGYGGLMGAISNITSDGFAPCAFHSYPSTLENDGISGDYGCGFFGYAVNTAAYITHHDQFGWLAFGGNLKEKGGWIETDLTTASRSRVFIAPVQTWLTLDAGKIKQVRYHPDTRAIRIILDAGNNFTNEAFLRVEGRTSGKGLSTRYIKNSRGVYVIPLGQKQTKIYL